MKNLTVLLLAVFFGGVLSFSDASTNWQLGFQDPATPYMEGITSFHNNIMFFIVLIVILGICLYIFFENWGEFQLKCIVSDKDGNKISTSAFSSCSFCFPNVDFFPNVFLFVRIICSPILTGIPSLILPFFP